MNDCVTYCRSLVVDYRSIFENFDPTCADAIRSSLGGGQHACILRRAFFAKAIIAAAVCAFPFGEDRPTSESCILDVDVCTCKSPYLTLDNFQCKKKKNKQGETPKNSALSSRQLEDTAYRSPQQSYSSPGSGVCV